MENKKVICPNCGASIYENEPACPFCAYINIPGAEKKFMHDIKKTEQDMSYIPELQKAEYKKSFSKTGKIILITVGIVAVIAVILLGIYKLYENFMYSYGQRDAKAQMIWNSENFPILDEMYEKGDYDGLVEFGYNLIDQNARNKTDYIMYEWEHYDFIDAYRKYTRVEECIAYLDEGHELIDFEKEDLVYYCLWYYDRQYDKDKTIERYTEEEKELLDEYRDITNSIMFTRLGFTQDEVEELLEKVTDEYGYLDLGECFKYGRKVGDRFQ